MHPSARASIPGEPQPPRAAPPPAALPLGALPRAALPLLAALGVAAPAPASGIYAVDDSATTPAGRGQIETFGSFGRQDSLVRFLPAVSFRALPTAEWTIGFERTRIAGEGVSALVLQSKLRLTADPETEGAVGWALSGAALVPGRGAVAGVFNSAATYMAGERLLLHANLGAVAAPEGAGLTWGVRSEATLVPERLTLHAELFGQSTGRPGFQLGLRPTLGSGRLDLELAFGHNLAGERADWLTVGTAIRF